MGCGCIFALFAAFTPRLAFVLLWIFTDVINKAFDTVIIPIIGLIFLPFTTLVYALIYTPGFGLSGWDFVWLILALMLDLSSYGGSAYVNRKR